MQYSTIVRNAWKSQSSLFRLTKYIYLKRRTSEGHGCSELKSAYFHSLNVKEQK